MLPNFQAIEKVCKKHRVIFVTLEADLIPKVTDLNLKEKMSKHGYKKGKWPLVPSKTLLVDLSQSEQDLWKAMKKDARLSIKKADKKCVVELLSSDGNNFKNFHCFFKKFGKAYIPTYSEFKRLVEAFGDLSFLVEVSLGKQIISGALILICRRQAYYYYACNSPVGRKFLAGYLAVWRAMLEARRRKCRYFDFEGIYDERFPNLKRWKGFSDFKKKFGGKEVIYPVPFVRFFIPFLPI
ncbi:hypothetical protein A2Z23_00970 [Candidatus Curtissbacteria bacterium RBG_16_39_7]|uniref:BioF2-like acetyltransferase domain-containing protein n=1 Tax=Candidatus Curtissbacteria bacterium RBG_16_39_7 TaxID=1797707 RepID=A0A1F5G2Y5_9BACT|nr:MAG: hypothetical protein A2Z23_00970 [Candidatus Curtissbacteria bacterium RBG_16_39_7]